MQVRKLFSGAILFSMAVFLCARTASAQLEMGFFNPYVTTGPRISPESMAPTLRKWYLPQSVYQLYGWKSWQYSNYARDIYQRYVNIELEGTRYYDIYGDYITKGWHLYSWQEEYPRDFGSAIFKHPNFSSWFDRLFVSYSSRGQFHSALTVGEAIRATLTPLTFSKPLFSGIQWDFATDKYGLTMLASRVSDPAEIAFFAESPAARFSTSTDLLGFRGVAQIGDFLKTGLTYVNASHRNTSIPLSDNSLKGVLSGQLNAGNVRTLVVRLSDDSPEDGVSGALLFRERIFVDGVEHPEVKPRIDGGIRMGGLLEASGGNTVTLTYDIEHSFIPTDKDEITDFREIHEIEVGLVLANDYKVEATSNLQTSNLGEPVFLLVTQAPGNIRDGSNQKYVKFLYGVPSGNEVAGITFEVSDLGGFNFRGEYALNSRFRRFPNQTLNTAAEQALATDKAQAFYATASYFFYPLFFYAEGFSLDPEYNTSMFIPDSKGFVDYKNLGFYQYEFVDDNDDQDRYPDWRRPYTGRDEYEAEAASGDREVFPGLDENNDLISDFNQNANIQPDYVEPFLRHDVDPPEFLFGSDMNNNTVIDRFENDMEPDYPYKRDHRGANAYAGVEITPGSKVMIGYLKENLISSDRKSTSTYGLLTLRKDLPVRALSLQFMHFMKNVHDNIPDDLIQWTQPPSSSGTMEDTPDPLIAQNTFVNTSYLEVKYDRFLPFTNKFKYEVYHQKGAQEKGTRDRTFFGIVNKADYRFPLRENLILWPKWKQMYQFMIPTKPGELKTKDLSEIFCFLTKYRFSEQLRINLGVEYEIFTNLLEKPDPVPPGFKEDFNMLTFAVQVSNSYDYMGYNLVSNVGVHWTRRTLEDKDTEKNTIAFVNVYAGAE